MSLNPPSLWIEPRGRQHRVYRRNARGVVPARSYQPLHSKAEAEQFINMAAFLRLGTAREVMAAEDVAARRPPLDTALAARGLTPTRHLAA